MNNYIKPKLTAKIVWIIIKEMFTNKKNKIGKK